MKNCFDVLIIGAGAAGLFCSIECGKRGRSVLVLEHSEKAGKKILLSGGGRCNFTNLNVTSANFISKNRNFCKSALARFTPQNFTSLLEKHKIEFFEKKAGQLFCRENAKKLLDMLLTECKSNNVQFKFNTEVQAIEKNEKFRVKTSDGEYEAASLVVATGGLSLPETGASDFGYRIAQQFGLNIIQPVPGLVPILFNDTDVAYYSKLSGISIASLVKCKKREFREKILF